MIGQTISHYKILAKLGGGGMGVVYKAQDLKLDRFVALKFLPHHLSADEEEKKRFIHEAKAASALDHPNICTIYEIDEAEDGQMFIAMAYYEGETLKKKVADGRLQVAGTIDIATQIAQGLAKAHQRGITHRDIKPANIFITTEGVVKILDWGLAKMAHLKLTKTGSTLGTADYMSPEQAAGKEVDYRTDIWSLGVVLYEMLAGETPFKGEHEHAVVYSILNEAPAPLSGNLAVPAELGRIVDKAMMKNTEARYQQMAEMLDDLRKLQTGVASGAVSSPAKTQMRLRRKKKIYAVVAGLLLLLIALSVALRQTAKKPPPALDLPEQRRLAVLPLANISPDPQDEYFADGMTEELISKLSNIGGLRVIALTSVLPYKGAAKSLPEIRRELNIGTVLTGSVRKAENAVRITVRLIDVRSQETLWSREYDRELKDIFFVQTDVAQQVADAMQVRLLAGEQRQIEKKATASSEAYTLYLQGRYFWNQWRGPAAQKAITYFEQAIAKDSTFALAYYGLADAYHLLGYLNVLPPKEVYPKAEAAALKALALDNMLSEAHLALAKNRLFYDWDLAGAERGVKRALELNASSVDALNFYSAYLIAIGKFDEAIAARKRAYELDPLSAFTATGLGWSFGAARQYDQAVEWFQKALELDSAYAIAYPALGLCYEQLKMYDAAVEAYLKQKSILGAPPETVAALREAYAASGIRGYWQKELDFAQKQLQRGPASPLQMAKIFIKLDEKDQAFQWLDKAYDQRLSLLVYLKADPLYDGLRTDSRFAALLKKMGWE